MIDAHSTGCYTCDVIEPRPNPESRLPAEAGVQEAIARPPGSLWESGDVLKAIIQSSPVAIITFDLQRLVQTWNPAAERMFGWREEEVLGKPIPYVTQDMLPESCGFMQRILKGESFYGMEARRIRKDGTPIEIEISSAPLRDSEGQIRGILAMCLDISARKEIENALRQSEARAKFLAQLLDNSSQPFAVANANGSLRFFNKAYCELLGYTAEEMADVNVFKTITPPEWEPTLIAIRTALINTGKPHRYEREIIRKGGSRIPVEVMVHVVFDPSGQVDCYYSFITDLSKRKRDQEAMIVQARILETMAEGVCVTNEQGIIEWTNTRFDELFGYSPGELLGQSAAVLNDYPPEENQKVVANLFAQLQTKGVWIGEFSNRRKDGSLFFSLATINSLLLPGRRLNISVQEDITERKRAEQILQDYAQKLQVLSRKLVEMQETERRNIARELHDQVGQALTAVQLNLQAALGVPAAGVVAHQLSDSLRAVDRVLEQIHDLSLDLRPSILDDLGLHVALQWYAHRQAARGQLRCKFRADSFPQRLDPLLETACFRIAQEAITNVLRHAKAQTLWVELRKIDHSFQLLVRDDGMGFDVAAARQRAVRGSSLGLLSMEERAALAGGRIECQSTPGQGTELRIWFPLKWLSNPLPEKGADR